MSKEKFQELVANHELNVIGEWTNEHGELFVVYRTGMLDYNFVTGDELGWQTGWMVNPMGRGLVKHFTLSDGEQSDLNKVLENYRKSYGDQ